MLTGSYSVAWHPRGMSHSAFRQAHSQDMHMNSLHVALRAVMRTNYSRSPLRCLDNHYDSFS